MPVIHYTPFVAFASKSPGVDSALTISETAEILHTLPSVVRYLIRKRYLHAVDGDPSKSSCRVLESEIAHHLKFWFPAKRSETDQRLAKTAAYVNKEVQNPHARAEAVSYKGYRGLLTLTDVNVEPPSDHETDAS